MIAVSKISDEKKFHKDMFKSKRKAFLCFLDLCLAHNGMNFECTHFVDNGSHEEKTIVATYYIANKFDV